MAATGIVRIYYAENGWGVIDSAATPGGAWVHFSEIDGEGYRYLNAGERVTFEPYDMAPGDQDGYRWRAERVARLDPEPPGGPELVPYDGPEEYA